MSFTEVMQELSSLTTEQRQEIISRALELDDFPFRPEDDALIEKRMAAHHADPATALPIEVMMARLEERLGK